MNDKSMKVEKEPKHLIINHCLDELEGEISRYENLVGKIEGSELAKAVDEERKPTSLVVFLDNTPDRLRLLTESLANYRKKIQEYLF